MTARGGAPPTRRHGPFSVRRAGQPSGSTRSNVAMSASCSCLRRAAPSRSAAATFHGRAPPRIGGARSHEGSLRAPARRAAPAPRGGSRPRAIVRGVRRRRRSSRLARPLVGATRSRLELCEPPARSGSPMLSRRVRANARAHRCAWRPRRFLLWLLHLRRRALARAKLPGESTDLGERQRRRSARSARLPRRRVPVAAPLRRVRRLHASARRTQVLRSNVLGLARARAPTMRFRCSEGDPTKLRRSRRGASARAARRRA